MKVSELIEYLQRHHGDTLVVREIDQDQYVPLHVPREESVEKDKHGQYWYHCPYAVPTGLPKFEALVFD